MQTKLDIECDDRRIAQTSWRSAMLSCSKNSNQVRYLNKSFICFQIGFHLLSSLCVIFKNLPCQFSRWIMVIATMNPRDTIDPNIFPPHKWLCRSCRHISKRNATWPPTVKPRVLVVAHCDHALLIVILSFPSFAAFKSPFDVQIVGEFYMFFIQ